MTKKRNLTEAAAEATAGLFSGIKKPLNATEQAILEKYNAGMTKQTDISEATGKDKGTVSRALKRIREDYPELLQEQPQKPAEQPKKPEPMESKTEPKKPQETKQKKHLKDYFKLDLDEYGGYVRDMAWYNRTTVTAYLQGLIAKDAEANAEIWEKIKK